MKMKVFVFLICICVALTCCAACALKLTVHFIAALGPWLSLWRCSTTNAATLWLVSCFATCNTALFFHFNESVTIPAQLSWSDRPRPLAHNQSASGNDVCCVYSDFSVDQLKVFRSLSHCSVMSVQSCTRLFSFSLHKLWG